MSSPRLFCSPRYSAVYIFSFVCLPGFYVSVTDRAGVPPLVGRLGGVSSSVRTSPRTAPVPLSVPACPPISAGISARSALPCTPGSSTRLLVVFPSDSQSVLSILLSYHFPFFCLSFFVECSSSQGRVFFRCSVRATSVSAFFSMLIVSDVIRLIPCLILK